MEPRRLSRRVEISNSAKLDIRPVLLRRYNNTMFKFLHLSKSEKKILF